MAPKGFIKMTHAVTNGETHVHPKAVGHYQEKGWVVAPEHRVDFPQDPEVLENLVNNDPVDPDDENDLDLDDEDEDA